MTKSFSLKAENKPILFSFDLETEFKNIDRWVFDNRNYARRDLEKEIAMLQLIAKDYIEIINNNITSTQLLNLKILITEGPSGIWENAINKLERLSYHFEEARDLIIELINSTKTATIERVLTALSNAFEIGELQKILANLFQHRSKTIRMKASNAAFRINKKEFINPLKQILEREHDKEVKSSIQFAIDHLNKLSN